MAEFRKKLRGAEAELNAIIGDEGLLVVDLTNLDLRLYDGVLAGGVRIPNIGTNDGRYLRLLEGDAVVGPVTLQSTAVFDSGFDLTGTASVTGTLDVTGPFDVTGATTLTGTLNVSAATSLSTLATSGDATLGSNLTVTADVSAGGNLDITGAATIRSDAAIFGNATVGGTVSIAGNNLTVNSDGGGGLTQIHMKSVAGEATNYLLSGDSGSVSDDFVFKHYTSAADAQDVTLSIKGTDLLVLDSNPKVTTKVRADFDDVMSVSGEATFLDGIEVTGASHFNSNVSFNSGSTFYGNIAVTGVSTFTGLATFNGGFVTGAAQDGTVGGDFHVDGHATVANSVLSSALSVVNRTTGDTRYLQRQAVGVGDSMNGPLGIIGVSPDNDALVVGDNTRVRWANDYVQWVSGAGFHGFENGVEAFRLESDPTAAPGTATAVITRAKGDSRYIQKTDSVIPTPVMDAIKVELTDFFLPVGIVITTDDNVNPGTRYAGTTWVPDAEGRTIVGVGSNGESTWAGGDMRGSETHTLTEAELAAHTHTGNTGTESDLHTHSGNTGAAGSHNHLGQQIPVNKVDTDRGASGYSSFFSIDESNPIPTEPDHTHAFTTDGQAQLHTHPFTSDSTGSGDAHNNIQPSIARYHWRRTA